jgi:hypothetical protein
MGKRRTTSRAVADLTPMARAPVSACAARRDGRNDDSVLLSRHRRLLSEPLMWGDGFNERGISQTTQPEELDIDRGASPCPLLSIEALSLAMTIREDRTMTNVPLWSLLWQKRIIDKHQRAGTAA